MDDAELTLRRTQMGRGISSIGTSAVTARVEDGWWIVLTGAPSPDMNMALLHRNDDEALALVLRSMEDVGCPALMMFAGEGRSLASQLPTGWVDVGAMPIMAVDLARTPTIPDSRVRRAGAADISALTALLAESYGMDPSAVTAMTSSAGRDDGLSLWILEQDGMGVSMVATHRDGASVSVWAMGTPARFGRRGYGRALLAHVLHEARQDGARQGLLGATPAGFPLYDATGWHTFDEWQIFTNATSAQFSH